MLAGLLGALVFWSLALQASPAPSGTALSPIASASPAAVDPVIEMRARDWLIRSQTDKPDRSQLTTSMNTRMTPDISQRAAALLTTLGTLDDLSYIATYSARGVTSYQFVATFSKGKINWLMSVTSDGKIAGLLFWPYEERKHLSQEQLLTDLRARLQNEAAAGTFAGAVLIAKDGKPIFSRAYGLADRERDLPNTMDTQFRIGSMNKMFTAVSVLQLVQAGKLGLDDPIGKYLPSYPNKDIATTVTVRELLTHTGGTGDIFGPEFDAHRLDLKTLDDYVNLYGSRAPLFKPGSRFDYSNYGFLLLGVIVQNVSGQSYYDYVREHVYTPAGMASTGSDPEDAVVKGRSVGYMSVDGKWQPNTSTLPYRGTSAGGGYSTVGDLYRFALALQTNKLLNARYTQMLTTGTVDMMGPPDMARKYAFGFADETVGGIRCFGHGGGAPGMNGDLEICPTEGYVIAVLANVDPPAAQDISSFVVDHLPAPRIAKDM